jgi:hypothetical protein
VRSAYLYLKLLARLAGAVYVSVESGTSALVIEDGARGSGDDCGFDSAGWLQRHRAVGPVPGHQNSRQTLQRGMAASRAPWCFDAGSYYVFALTLQTALDAAVVEALRTRAAQGPSRRGAEQCSANRRNSPPDCQRL